MSCLAQPVESVLNKYKRLRKILKLCHKIPHRVRNQTIQTECNSDYKWPRNNINKAKYTNCHFGKSNPMNRLFRFPNLSIWLRKDLKTCQNLPYKVRNSKRQMEFKSDSECPRTNTNKENYPNCHSGKPNPMNQLVWFSNQSRWLRKDFKKIQNLPYKVRNLTR